MPLFGNRQRRVTPAPAPTIAPPTDRDLEELRSLLQQFAAAVGSDPHVRAAVLAISTKGGSLSMEESIRQAMATGDPDVDRPWRWLGQAAQAAQLRGDWGLLADLGLFTGMFMTSLAPNLTVADEMDMQLSGGSQRSLGIIYSAVLETLAGAPDVVMLDHPTGRVTVPDVRLMCAVGAAKLGPGMLSPDASRLAGMLLG